jgi:mannan endo-1,4-beta-mannosidase
MRFKSTSICTGSVSSRLHPHRADRLSVLDAIQAANLKVLRLFISETFENFKRTGSVYMPDIEPETVGVYDDTQLEAIDQLMVEAQERGTVQPPYICGASFG